MPSISSTFNMSFFWFFHSSALHCAPFALIAGWCCWKKSISYGLPQGHWLLTKVKKAEDDEKEEENFFAKRELSRQNFNGTQSTAIMNINWFIIISCGAEFFLFSIRSSVVRFVSFHPQEMLLFSAFFVALAVIAFTLSSPFAFMLFKTRCDGRRSRILRVWNLWRERGRENLLKFLSASWLFNQDISWRHSQIYSEVLRRSIMIKFLRGNFCLS